MKHKNMGANPPKSMGIGSSNDRKGMVKETKMMGSNMAEKQAMGAPGASNPRQGSINKTDAFQSGTYSAMNQNPGAGKISMGNPGSNNDRKGTLSKTAMFAG